MRIPALTMMACLCLTSAACAQDEKLATLDYTVLDATPVVPLRALQIFQVDEAGTAGSIGMTWGEAPLPMPDQGSLSTGEAPPFRLCAVALGDPGDVILHAVSPPVELVLDETVEVVLTLEEAPDGGVPDPCGPGVEPWPPEA